MPPLERLKECVGFTMSGNFLISFLMSTEERYFLGEGILSITMKQSLSVLHVSAIYSGEFVCLLLIFDLSVLICCDGSVKFVCFADKL